MKEEYFTSQNIDEQSELLFLQLNCKNNNLNFYPANSALLILDMQNFFLNSDSHAFIPSAVSIVSRINRLADLFNKATRPVIMTKHINNDEDAGMMNIWWKDIIRKNAFDSEICSQLNHINSYVIEKSQYDAFYQTDLNEYLKTNNIKQLLVTGVMTHLCCETTIRSAFVRGYQIFFPVDTTATYNKEFHKAAFTNLSHGFAVPVLTKHIEELFNYG